MLEIDLDALKWVKSPYSTSGNCVELATRGRRILVRNSNDPQGAVVAFTASEWAAFLAWVDTRAPSNDFPAP